ncbi:unnamed protein product [Mytilus coruscus]|uniref:B box-type domain-containing protein n=1 Tax=Mytilus coruscus TaxID=42192 RepID=A0A6J8E0M5_MYTCO|nr:unnamed protein product [Mytilus coruscus]
MVTANPVQIIQVHVGCQLCQGKNTIQWQCMNCQFLMCTSCKDNIHLRIAKDHTIIHIDDIEKLDSGESFNFSDVPCNQHANQVCCFYCRTCQTVVCLKCVMPVHNGHEFVDELEFLSKKKKLWEGHKNAVKKLGEQLSTAEPKLRKIKESETIIIHVTKDNRVIIGAKSPGPVLLVRGRRVVLVYQEGNHLKEYEHDSNINHYLTYHRSITSTSNGIFVIDRIDADRRGRVIALEERGNVIQIYCGHPDINTERKPFKPARMENNCHIPDLINKSVITCNIKCLQKEHDTNLENC